jgi:hypothetical protein
MTFTSGSPLDDFAKSAQLYRTVMRLAEIVSMRILVSRFASLLRQVRCGPSGRPTMAKLRALGKLRRKRAASSNERGTIVSLGSLTRSKRGFLAVFYLGPSVKLSGLVVSTMQGSGHD